MKLFKRRIPEVSVPGTRGAVVSDVGRLRRNNEDNYLLGQIINEDCRQQAGVAVTCPGAVWSLAGVFDGMGGGEKGELAALLAAQTFREASRELALAASEAEADRIIREAFQQANNRVVPLRTEFGAYGTTGTVVCTNAIVFKLYYLGDSRAYLLRRGDLFQLSRDHTLAQLKIETGIYTPEDPQAKRDGNRLTEYIGRDETGGNIGPEESQWIRIMPGDSLLLCSDGLYDMCGDPEISAVMQGTADPETRAAMLVERALERGGEDNVTCICLEFVNL